MPTTNFLVRRLSRERDEFEKKKQQHDNQTEDVLTTPAVPKFTPSSISLTECQHLKSKLSDPTLLPEPCKAYPAIFTMSGTEKKPEEKPTVKRRLSYVAMHDYPPTAC